MFVSKDGRTFFRCKDVEFQNEEARALEAKAAALLHDIGHAPFGHCTERFIRWVTKLPFYSHLDKYYSQMYIRNKLGGFLRNLGFDPNILARIIGPGKDKLEGFHRLIADIVDSPIDVDRMDFLLRDAYFTARARYHLSQQDLTLGDMARSDLPTS